MDEQKPAGSDVWPGRVATGRTVPAESKQAERVVSYLKWPTELHYRARMVFLGEDSAGVWMGNRRGAMIERPGKVAGHSSQDSVTLFPRGAGWSSRWYSARGVDGRAAMYCCYVDVTTPPEITPTDIRLVDLDLDVAKTWDGEVVLLDEDEFTRNRLIRDYPLDVVRRALRTAETTRSALTHGWFPFDGAADPYLDRWFATA